MLIGVTAIVAACGDCSFVDGCEDVAVSPTTGGNGGVSAREISGYYNGSRESNGGKASVIAIGVGGIVHVIDKAAGVLDQMYPDYGSEGAVAGDTFVSSPSIVIDGGQINGSSTSAGVNITLDYNDAPDAVLRLSLSGTISNMSSAADRLVGTFEGTDNGGVYFFVDIDDDHDARVGTSLGCDYSSPILQDGNVNAFDTIFVEDGCATIYVLMSVLSASQIQLIGEFDHRPMHVILSRI